MILPSKKAPQSVTARRALPDSSPGYWMLEPTGVLVPAVQAYLQRRELTPTDMALLQAYLSRWIHRSFFHGPAVDVLRLTAAQLETREDIVKWSALALDAGVDPW